MWHTYVNQRLTILKKIQKYTPAKTRESLTKWLPLLWGLMNERVWCPGHWIDFPEPFATTLFEFWRYDPSGSKITFNLQSSLSAILIWSIINSLSGVWWSTWTVNSREKYGCQKCITIFLKVLVGLWTEMRKHLSACNYQISWGKELIKVNKDFFNMSPEWHKISHGNIFSLNICFSVTSVSSFTSSIKSCILEEISIPNFPSSYMLILCHLSWTNIAFSSSKKKI